MNAAEITHPLVGQIELQMHLGRLEAEEVLRGRARTDPAAAQAIKQIDDDRAKLKAATVKRNSDMAAVLGLSMDQARDMIGKLAAHTDVLTWLTGRVNVTIAHDRPLAHDE